MTWACKPACMHAMCLHAQAHITAKLGWIREIKISMESEHARPLWTHNLTWARRLACMHTMCLHTQAHISAKLGQIREIKISLKSEGHAGYVWAHNMTHVCAHYIFACMGHHSAKLHQNVEIKVNTDSQDYFLYLDIFQVLLRGWWPPKKAKGIQ